MAINSQITVRVAADLVDWLDAEVAAGRFPSRAAGVAKALRRARRLREDEEDLAKYQATPETEDERSLRKWAAKHQAWPIDAPAAAAPGVAD